MEEAPLGLEVEGNCRDSNMKISVVRKSQAESDHRRLVIGLE